MKTQDGIPGSILIKNKRYFIQLSGIKYYTKLLATKSNLRLAEEYKKKLFLGELGIIQKKKSLPSLHEAFEEFIEQIETNREPGTIAMKRISYNRILQNVNSINSESIETAIIQFIRNNKTLQPTTINSYLQNLQVFLSHLVEKKYLQNVTNYAKKYKQKEVQTTNKYFTFSEFDKMYSYCSKLESERFDYIHFAELLKYLYYSGSRISEALSLKKSQIKKDFIVLSNKMNKTPEKIFLNEPIREVIANLSEREKIFKWYPSSKSFMVKKLNEVLKKCQIEKAGRNIHSFRKSYLRELFDNSVPVQIASKLMRHSKITTTIKHYAEFDDSELKSYAENLGTK